MDEIGPRISSGDCFPLFSAGECVKGGGFNRMGNMMDQEAGAVVGALGCGVNLSNAVIGPRQPHLDRTGLGDVRTSTPSVLTPLSPLSLVQINDVFLQNSVTWPNTSAFPLWLLVLTFLLMSP